jgi:hypothetical protein
LGEISQLGDEKRALWYTKVFFWGKNCVSVATLLGIFFWSHHIYHLNGNLVIASNEIIFGGDFEKILEICVVQWNNYLNKISSLLQNIFSWKRNHEIKKRLNKSEYTKNEEN